MEHNYKSGLSLHIYIILFKNNKTQFFAQSFGRNIFLVYFKLYLGAFLRMNSRLSQPSSSPSPLPW